MNIRLLVIGKTDESMLETLIEKYQKRLKHYINFSFEVIPDIKNSKNLSQNEQKNKEGELILKKVVQGEILLLLDERGKNYTSVEFAQFIEQKLNTHAKQLTFAVGGAYGFSSAVYERANGLCSLSKMTFSHQMIRLFFTEQLYRAFTILNNEPYHHQ